MDNYFDEVGGNGVDVWPGASGGGEGVTAVGQLKADLQDMADWIMKYHEELKVRYMIMSNKIWNPLQDDMGIWDDCSASRRCPCVEEGICQNDFDHLHITVL